jgi:ubiquinone/menaquinone biosynthesis C-methylase UbiE
MDPTARFNGRATVYHAHRPRYPKELLNLLTAECDLTPASIIAEFGSGTGILTELFLKHGNVVHAVEPNAAMREVAENNLSGNPRFHSINATAESTGLPGNSIDFIIAGQAFHWFDRPRAAAEFARVLRPRGWTVLVWNERLTTSTPFAAAYEDVLIHHSIDYVAMDPKKVSGDAAAMAEFLGPDSRMASFHHTMPMTFDDLVGLLASASYAPLPGHPKHASMIDALRAAFEAHAANGIVPLDYEMKVYYARRLI